MSKGEPQAPQRSFWRSPQGILTGVTIGVAVVGGMAAMRQQPAPQPSPEGGPPRGITRVGTNAAGQTAYDGLQQGYYLFDVLAQVDPAQYLAAVGFGHIQTQPDPMNYNNWLVSAYWTGGSQLVDGGPGSWQMNEAMGLPSFIGDTVPPVPQPYSGLAAAQWYTFSIRTAFVQSASRALQVVQSLLAKQGWAPNALVTAAADASSTPDTWNIAAQWAGTLSETQDAPPLWFYVSQPTPAGTSEPPQPGTGMP